MAIAYISEYKNLVTDESGRVIQVPAEPAVTTQIVTFTVSVQSAAFAASTRFVRIVCDTKGHFVFGTNPTAITATSPYMAADMPEFFGVPRGADYKVAVVT